MNDDTRGGLVPGRPSDEEARLARILAGGLAMAVPSPAPDRLRPQIDHALSRVRPRPRWLAYLKERPMRHASRVVVGSPTARMAVLAAAMLLALLGAGALVVGAQSPSPAPPEAAPQPPVGFTGTWCAGDPVAPDRAGIDEAPVAVGDEVMMLIRNRRGAWHNAVTTSDPRLQGDAYQTYETDTYVGGRSPSPSQQASDPNPGASSRSMAAFTLRIENADGAWRAVAYEFPAGSGNGLSPIVLVGEGAYAGLIAIIENPSPGFCSPVRGTIFDAAPIPQPYIPR